MLGKLAVVVPALVFAGCDIMAIDNWEEPSSYLTGALTFNGKPVGVRVSGVNLQLWQVEPNYPLEAAIPVRVSHAGTFSAVLFDGTYEINLIPGNGPWVDDPTRREVRVRGDTELEIPVQPFFTLENVSLTYDPGPGPGGSITATFNVVQHVQGRTLDFVGLYIGLTPFVDRATGLPIANSIRELTRAQIQPLLDANSPITITVPLPDDIHLTPSPERRDFVYVRVGVQTSGVSEMLFSQLEKVSI